VDRRGDLRPDALESAIQLFLDAKLVTIANAADVARAERAHEPRVERVYVVPDERRLALEYHKNSVLHFFVASALVASSLAALGWECELVALRDRVRTLSRLFKLEFMYRADAEFEQIFSDALGAMIESDDVLWEADRVRRAGGDAARRLALYENMLRTYVEGYRFALRAVIALRPKAGAPKDTTRKEWIKATLAAGRRAFSTGEVVMRESIARPKLETALAMFHELGIVRIEGETLKLGPKIDDAVQLEALLGEHLRAE
jgi:glycerol-3-phosphate O-acyltransferase